MTESFRPELCPDVDAAIESVYAFHHRSTTHNDDIVASLKTLADVRDRTHTAIENSDSVGRLASLLNLCFEHAGSLPRGRCDVPIRQLVRAYICALTSFLTKRSVIDEQHWTAAYRVLTRYSFTDKAACLALCNALRDARVKPPFTLKAEFKLQVVEVHKLVRV